jgi:hypothetical protein
MASFVFMTGQGELIGDRVLSAVTRLMQDMERRGVTPDELITITRVIEVDPDRALSNLSNLAVTRRFDASQAFEIVHQLGRVNPFDQVEACVQLYPALMNTESFHVVLSAFDDDEDRKNVCHRLRLDFDKVMCGKRSG